MRVALVLLLLQISCVADESVESKTTGLRAAYIAAVQKDGDRFDGLTAENTAQKFRASFSSAGLRIDHERFTFELAVAAISCEKDPARVEPEVAGKEVVYRRGDVVEWYRSGALGIEQGFELRDAARCAPEIELRSNLAPVLDKTSASILFGGVVRYSDLYVTDAHKKQLPARFAVAGDRVFIRFDDRGATYPVSIDPLVWTEQAQLLSADFANGDLFGSAVAFSVDTAVIGAPLQADLGPGAGAAYVFTRTGTVWREQAKLRASSGFAEDNFGHAVAVDAATAVIGAPFHDQGAENAGAAYVYTRTGTVWREQAKLLASDAAAFSGFGRNVELDGDRAVIAAPEHDQATGMTYVFTRTGTVWSEEQQLVPSSLLAVDAYGFDVALSGDTAAVSNYRHQIFFFRRSASIWTEEDRIAAVATGESFANTMALDGDTLIAGDREDPGFGLFAGAAHVYVRNAGVWSLEQTLRPIDAHPGQRFGGAVSISGDLAAIGAYGDNELGTEAGAVYLFQRTGGTWSQTQKLLASNGGAQAFFGRAVVVSGAYTLAGSGLNGGPVYAFAFGLALGDPCTNNTDCPLGFCADGVCCDNACGGGDPSDCQACSVARGAATDGTCAVVAADTECRAAAGACDLAELCDGARPECPSDQLAEPATECRPVNGDCDTPELCIGTAECPMDRFKANGTRCRPALDVCDRAESCNGTSAACPEDQYAPAGTMCGPSAGACDVGELCTGASSTCPANMYLPAGTECRAASSVCDLPETCRGGEANCPGDQVMIAGTVCRAAVDTCDAVETCDGTASTCPIDQSIADCPPPPPPEEEGCGCNAAKRSSSAWLLLVLLLAQVITRQHRVMIARRRRITRDESIQSQNLS